ncbi:MAG TPA: DUF523 and DUF1722 domain-containing protein [Verrucomicrobiae bacterium]|nr:DUF523 and DUF1722 domain-containing protein [Verrucomicrobiae bacterium]
MTRRRGYVQTEAMAPLRLGISACLLGQAVRYDGGHKRDPFLAETLGRFVEWVPVCPEVELGLGIPREPIRLEGDPAAPRLVAVKSRRDLTRAMARLARARAEQLARLDLVGYVLKADSPSCGMERVRVHRDRGPARRRGTGLFARTLMERLPLLPVEEEGRLRDDALRASFIERVFAYARWKGAVAAGMTRPRLAAFHAAHEALLRAHDPGACRRLGALVANAGKRSLRAAVADYGAGFVAALRTQVVPTRRRAPGPPAPPAARRSPTARPAASRPAPRRPRSSP